MQLNSSEYFCSIGILVWVLKWKTRHLLVGVGGINLIMKMDQIGEDDSNGFHLKISEWFTRGKNVLFLSKCVDMSPHFTWNKCSQ